MDSFDNSLTRRQVVQAAIGAAAAAAGLVPIGAAAQRGADDRYSPFLMGMQSYSLRAFGFDEALDTTRRLGLRYWEAFPEHIPQTDDAARIKQMLARLKSADISLWAWGVVPFSSDEAKARSVFEFARAMGIRVITADPTPDSLPVLDKLLEEYKKHNIAVAIHNHGPGARYDSIDSVARALRGHHPRLGACVDTGHFLRSGEDPVEAVKTFGVRTLDVHLKDVKGKTEFTEIGRGDLRTADLLYELRRLKYNGIVALEYEEHEKEPMPYIDICLAATRDAVAKVKNRR